MYRIALINMPFTNLELPSIALTQIRAMIHERFSTQVSIEVHYLNHDFAKYFGMECYEYLGRSFGSLHAGLGDWFFRQEAFPELPDNTSKYLERYFPVKNQEYQKLMQWIAEKRQGLGRFMDELVSRYDLEKVQVAGFTSMFMQNVATFAMALKIKQRNPNVITVIGGANCELPMGQVIVEQVKQIDFVFSGPALKSFPDFVQLCLDGDTTTYRPIRGVFSKGAPELQSKSERIGEELSINTPIELDYEPFISRIEHYFPNGEVVPVLPFETSRGCWWGERAHCTFCGLNGESMSYRAMKSELAIELINSLFRYSGRARQLTAVDNILPKSYFGEVLPFLDTPKDMELFYEIKADLSEDDMEVLAKARVKHVQPGVESLASSTLKLMKKGTTAFQNVNFLKLCAQYGVHPYWNLLVGFPGEGENVYRRYVEVMPLLVHLCPPSGAYPVRFDRFSPYHDQQKSFGLDLSPMDFYSLVYPFTETDLSNFAYYFADRNSQAEYVFAIAKWIGKLRAAIAQWQACWDASKRPLPPRLYFKDDSTTIFDSRSGTRNEYSVGEIGKAILDHLVKPTRIDDVIKVFSAREVVDVTRQITILQEKRLLFQEGDRLLSLVLYGEHGSGRAQYAPNRISVPAPKPVSVAVASPLIQIT
jgi:ribosomal peptide maturation radical SAM protein 1